MDVPHHQGLTSPSTSVAGRAETTVIRCPVCLRPSARAELKWRGGYSICRCGECGSLFSDPLPSDADLDAYYQGFLYRRPDPREIPRRVAARRREISALFGLGRGVPPGARFLDHGGGTGAAFGAARELGLASYYADLDRDAVAFVREQFGLDDAHFVSDLKSFEGRFDYIFSDNVIEHAPDPATLLGDLVAALAPGGTLVVKTPNAAATEHYFYPLTLAVYLRTAWKHNPPSKVLRMTAARPIWYCDPPRHVYSFSASGLLELARRIGSPNDDVRVEYYGTPAFSNSITGTVFRRPKGVRSFVTRMLALPVVPVELASKPLQRLSVAIGLVSPGGLILRIGRSRN